MASMFTFANFKVLNLSSFDTSKVKEMQQMFSYFFPTQLDISSFTFNNVEEFSEMFDHFSTSCEILVKDEAAKTWINTNFPTLTNVKIKTADVSA